MSKAQQNGIELCLHAAGLRPAPKTDFSTADSPFSPLYPEPLASEWGKAASPACPHCLLSAPLFPFSDGLSRCPLPVRLAPPRFAFQVTPCSLHVTSCTPHTLKNPWRSSSLSLLKILLFPFSVLEIKRKGGRDYKGTALLGFNPILSWWLLFSPLTGL